MSTSLSVGHAERASGSSHPRREAGRVILLARRPEPGTAATPPDVLSHLDLVDGLLTEAVSDLSHLWTVRIENHAPVDVLGHQDLPQLLDRLTRSGGKRIRPVMSYLGWLSASGRAREVGHADVVRVGAALELLHLFALVHDDVMDESDSRRGQPSVHTLVAGLHAEAGSLGDAGRFGESIAILLGDLAHAEADQLAAELPAEMRRLWRVLVVELVCGQRRDLTGSAAGRRDLEHARTVARMKSGAYTVERPLELGAVAARAPEVVHDSLRRYGRELGEAFALRDDLLGVWGDPERTGKPAGDDLLSGKPTVIMSLAGQRLGDGVARGAFERIGTGDFDGAEVALLQEELAGCGIVETVEGMIAGHVERALAALEEPALEADGVVQLTRMACSIAWRDA